MAAHGNPHPDYTGSVTVVNLTPHDDGLIHHGDKVRFDVVTDAPRPAWVMEVFANADTVLADGTVPPVGKQLAVGSWYDFYPEGSNEVEMKSQYWTAGAGDGTTLLYYIDGKKNPTIDTLEFSVVA